MEGVLIVVIILVVLGVRGWWVFINTKRNSTRVCRECGMHIPYNAKICPFCKRDPGKDVLAGFELLGRLKRNATGKGNMHSWRR